MAFYWRANEVDAYEFMFVLCEPILIKDRTTTTTKKTMLLLLFPYSMMVEWHLIGLLEWMRLNKDVRFINIFLIFRFAGNYVREKYCNCIYKRELWLYYGYGPSAA